MGELQVDRRGAPWRFSGPGGSVIYVPASVVGSRKLARRLSPKLQSAEHDHARETAVLRSAIRQTLACCCQVSREGVLTPVAERQGAIDCVACSPDLVEIWDRPLMVVVVRRVPRGPGWPEEYVDAGDELVNLLVTIAPRSASRTAVLAGTPITEQTRTKLLAPGDTFGAPEHRSYFAATCALRGTADSAAIPACPVLAGPHAPRSRPTG